MLSILLPQHGKLSIVRLYLLCGNLRKHRAHVVQMTDGFFEGNGHGHCHGVTWKRVSHYVMGILEEKKLDLDSE